MSQYGSLRELPFPEGEHAAYSEAVERYRGLIRQLNETRASLDGLYRQKVEAEAADRAALAEALRLGKPDPGDKALKKAEEAVWATQRQVEGLTGAALGAEQAVLRTVEAIAPEWLAALRDSEDTARAEYLDSIDRASAARDRLINARSLASWVTEFVTDGRPFRPKNPALPLSSMGGDRYDAATVFDALRTDANPPKRVVGPAARNRWPGG